MDMQLPNIYCLGYEIKEVRRPLVHHDLEGGSGHHNTCRHNVPKPSSKGWALYSIQKLAVRSDLRYQPVRSRLSYPRSYLMGLEKTNLRPTKCFFFCGINFIGNCVCMCICVYIHVCMCVCIYVFVCKYICVYVHVCIGGVVGACGYTGSGGGWRIASTAAF